MTDSKFPIPKSLRNLEPVFEKRPNSKPQTAQVAIGMAPLETPSPPKVSKKDVQSIFRDTLLPEHATDPNVIGFIKQYLLCRDPRTAAKSIGLKGADGITLFRRNDIYEAIRQITELAILKHGFEADELIERVKDIVRFDPIDLENPDGSFKKSFHEMTPEARKSIKKVKVKNLFGEDPNGMQTKIGEMIEFEFYDKLQAVELLGREKGVFKKTNVIEHDLTKNMSDVLLESRRRAEERDVSIPSTATKLIEEIIKDDDGDY